MIGRIRGTLIAKQPPELLVETSDGVGYDIVASMNTFYQLPAINETITLYTHLAVREDAHTLFGFYDNSERALFRALIKVNGVGPRLALAILSSITPNAFADCLQHNDSAALVKIPGIGKKTAERLIIEMRDSMSNWADAMPVDAATASVRKTATAATTRSVLPEAISALVALGYRPADASRLLNAVYDESLSCEALIRLALREVSV